MLTSPEGNLLVLFFEMRLEIRVMASLVKRGVQPLKGHPRRDSTRLRAGWAVDDPTRPGHPGHPLCFEDPAGQPSSRHLRFPCEKNPDGPKKLPLAIFRIH